MPAISGTGLQVPSNSTQQTRRAKDFGRDGESIAPTSRNESTDTPCHRGMPPLRPANCNQPPPVRTGYQWLVEMGINWPQRAVVGGWVEMIYALRNIGKSAHEEYIHSPREHSMP